VATELTKMLGQRKDVEMEINDLDKTRVSFETRVTEAQQKANDSEEGYRSVKDFEAQLSDYAKRLEKIQFDTDKLMAELEKLEHADKNARSIQSKLDEEERAQTASYEEAAADVTREVKALKEERADVVSQLSPELLERYAAAVKRFGGIAVETLDGNKPSACRVALQPSQFSDIRHGPVITECPYCHRILVTES
jgi:predicted  nucleic acid-binding Zn-ribbon protein